VPTCLVHNCEAVWRFCLSDLAFTFVLWLNSLIPINTVTSSAYLFLSSFFFGYCLHQCPFSSYLKHLTTIFISCLLIHYSPSLLCITLLLNTSNLFWEIVSLSSSFLLFLQFQAKCLNFLQYLYNFFVLPSNSSLSLMREYCCLSIVLIKSLYCCRDIILCLRGIEWMIDLTSYTMSTGVQDLHLARVLLPY